MTKKDYIAIADIIHTTRLEDWSSAEHAITCIEVALCVLFKQDNPNFNKEKFLEACK